MNFITIGEKQESLLLGMYILSRRAAVHLSNSILDPVRSISHTHKSDISILAGKRLLENYNRLEWLKMAYFKDKFPNNQNFPNLDRLEHQLCAEFDIPSLKEVSRKREIVICRQFIMVIAKKTTKMSLAAIGEKYGGKDHATVLHALKTIPNVINQNESRSNRLRDFAIENSIEVRGVKRNLYELLGG